MITAFCCDDAPARSSAWRICGSDNPPMAKPPTCKNDRRETPSHNRSGPPSILSIGQFPARPRFGQLNHNRAGWQIKLVPDRSADDPLTSNGRP